MEFVINLQSFLQSCNKSLINQTCSGPYWENIGPRSFLYGPRCARSVLSRPRADILPVRPSRLVNKIYKSTIQKTEGDVKLLQSFLKKKKKKMKKEKWKTFPADDLKTYISKFIIATEPRRPWKRLKCIEDSPGK